MARPGEPWTGRILEAVGHRLEDWLDDGAQWRYLAWHDELHSPAG